MGATGFKGNKAALPTKPCATCGRPMSWRRAWAANWDAVRHCSEACRRQRARGGAAAAATEPAATAASAGPQRHRRAAR